MTDSVLLPGRAGVDRPVGRANGLTRWQSRARMSGDTDADTLLDSLRGLVIVVLSDGTIAEARGGFGGFLGLPPDLEHDVPRPTPSVRSALPPSSLCQQFACGVYV